MVVRLKWAFLVYRLPREPSTPRLASWRRLRRLGVVEVTDGVVAVPLDAGTKEQLEWLAQEVVEEGGEASPWIADAGSVGQERLLAERMPRRRLAWTSSAGACPWSRRIRWSCGSPVPSFDGLYEHRRRALLLGRDPA